MGGDGVRLAVVPAPQSPDVLAAGVVVFRAGRHVLLVHRPKYDDWSFPKGKLDPGEHSTTAAVREVLEETGVRVRLGPALTGQRYANGERMKTVHYWVGWASGDDDISGYAPNDEIDAVAWVPYDEALEQLTYPHDAETLREARKLRKVTHAVLVSRHAAAQSRKSWSKSDRTRPLTEAGREQSEQLVPLLAAYDASRIVSSNNTRCVETMQPYAATTGWTLEEYDVLSEEGASAAGVAELIDKVLADDRGVVLCTHRPVLPAVLGALRIGEFAMEPAELLVVHVRKNQIVALERHRPS